MIAGVAFATAMAQFDALRTDTRELDGGTADLLVVGAGIQGAALARDAAMRGLSVVLCDARDIAAGTSSRSSRLVHGGLRYLRQGHLSLVRESLRERERLLRQCPHLVRPVPMVMPFFRDGGGSPWLTRIGTSLYARLAGDSTMPRPRSLSAREAAAAFPGLRTAGLRSAVEFFDAATQDTRLTLANVIAAAESGTRVATHCAVEGVTAEGVRLVDRTTGREANLQVHQVLNATGPGVDALRRAFGVEGDDLTRQSRGSHLVLPPRSGETALTAFLPDGRIQFVIPHDDGTLCGTTDVDDSFGGEEGGPPAGDLEYLHEALGFLLDPVPERADVRFAYAGWRALPAGKGPPGALNREAFTVTERIACGKLHSVVGGKLTTHRSFAERVMARLFDLPRVSPTRGISLPGGDGPREVSDPLWWRHGSRAPAVRRLIEEDYLSGEPLCPHRPFLIAEAVNSVRHEGVVAFADLMLRRLVHSQGPCMESDCIRRAHAVFAREQAVEFDADSDQAIASLAGELDAMCGELAAWRVTPSSTGSRP